MKRLLLLLLLAIPCLAQQTILVQVNSGVLTLDVERYQSFKVTLGQNVSSLVLQTTTGIPPNKTISITFTQDGTGGRTVSFGSVNNPCSVATAASATTICQIQFDAFTQTWNGVGNVGASVSANNTFTGNNTLSGLTTTGTGSEVFPSVVPLNLLNACGTLAAPITFFGNQKPCTATSMSVAVPFTTVGAYAWYGHRADVAIPSGIDVQQGANEQIYNQCNSQNSSGTPHDNGTTCVDVFAEIVSTDPLASAGMTSQSFQAVSAFTGLGSHTVQASQQLNFDARSPGWFGDVLHDYSPIQTQVIVNGSLDVSAYMGYGSSSVGHGALFGDFCADVINSCHAILHGPQKINDSGVWVSSAATYGTYIGALNLYSENSVNAPTFAADTPIWGDVLGPKAANSGQSNITAWDSTTAGTSCTLLASPNGASESSTLGANVTFTCNAAIAGEFNADGFHIAHITGVGVSGYNIDCIIKSVASPSFTCYDPNIVGPSQTSTTTTESGTTMTFNFGSTCFFTTGMVVTVAGVANPAPATNNGYNGATTVLAPGCNGGTSFTGTNQNGLSGLASSTGGTVTGYLLASGSGTAVASTIQRWTKYNDNSGNMNFGYSSPPSTGTPNGTTVGILTPSGNWQLTAAVPQVQLNGSSSIGRFLSEAADIAITSDTNGKNLRFLTNNGSLNQQMVINSAGNTSVKTVTADLGAACTNGELALSAGWQSTGSATVTAVTGISQTCEWTITTGTTTAANPTVTDTLVQALPVGTIVCEMTMHGGTAATILLDQTTLSATAPVFTAQGTPTAGGATLRLVRRCGP
jgi:hypothetical protein